MSDPVSALQDRVAEGPVTIRDTGPRGMITLKGDLDHASFAKACKAATGLAVPNARQVTSTGDMAVAWMAPDEVIILVPRADVPTALAKVDKALAGSHYLAVDVSDARAVIAVEGAGVREVLARLTPADMHPDALPAGEIRRTRLGQVAAAFWLQGAETAEVICFRSFAAYVFDLLANAASGAPVGHIPKG